MSVLARMRKLSQYEFYTNALKLRKSMRFLLLRDLGIKVKKIPKDVVKRQRRKMRKLARLAAEGQITLKEFQTQYKSWRGDKKRYHAYHTLCRLDSEERKLEKWIRSTHSTQTA